MLRARAIPPPAAILGPLLNLAVSAVESGADRADHAHDRCAGRAGGSLRPLAVHHARRAARRPRPCQSAASTSISTSRSHGFGRPPTAWSPTIGARGRADRGRPAHWLRCPAKHQGPRPARRSVAAPGLSRPPASRRGRPGDGSTTPSLPIMLLVDWKKYSPSIRTAILDMLLSRTTWTSSLLSSLEDGCVPPAEIDPARRQQLLTRRTSQLKSRAEAVFAHQNKPRQAVVDAYRAALEITETRPPARASSRSCVPRATASATRASKSAPTSPP